SSTPSSGTSTSIATSRLPSPKEGLLMGWLRSARAVVVLAALAPAVPAVAQPPREYVELLRQGDEARSQGRWGDAVAAFDRAAQLAAGTKGSKAAPQAAAAALRCGHVFRDWAAQESAKQNKEKVVTLLGEAVRRYGNATRTDDPAQREL